MRVFQNGEERTGITADEIKVEIFKPLANEFSAHSNLEKYYIKKYENDVYRYDRAVSSKTFMLRLLREFIDRFEKEDSDLIRFVNRNHRTIKLQQS
jgi:hypothetical protein